MKAWLANYHSTVDHEMSTLLIIANTWKQALKVAQVAPDEPWELQSVSIFHTEGILIHAKAKAQA